MCEGASAEDVRETVEQDPVLAYRYVKILDVTAPQYSNGTCRSDLMTVRGVIHAIVRFQSFNGRQYIRIATFGLD